MAKKGLSLAEWSKTDESASDPDRKVRTMMSLRDDGKVLRKHTWFTPDGKVDHSTGWTVALRVRKEATLTEKVMIANRYLEPRGYTRTNG